MLRAAKHADTETETPSKGSTATHMSIISYVVGLSLRRMAQHGIRVPNRQPQMTQAAIGRYNETEHPRWDIPRHAYEHLYYWATARLRRTAQPGARGYNGQPQMPLAEVAHENRTATPSVVCTATRARTSILLGYCSAEWRDP